MPPEDNQGKDSGAGLARVGLCPRLDPLDEAVRLVGSGRGILLRLRPTHAQLGLRRRQFDSGRFAVFKFLAAVGTKEVLSIDSIIVDFKVVSTDGAFDDYLALFS